MKAETVAFEKVEGFLGNDAVQALVAVAEENVIDQFRFHSLALLRVLSNLIEYGLRLSNGLPDIFQRLGIVREQLRQFLGKTLGNLHALGCLRFGDASLLVGDDAQPEEDTGNRQQYGAGCAHRSQNGPGMPAALPLLQLIRVEAQYGGLSLYYHF